MNSLQFIRAGILMLGAVFAINATPVSYDVNGEGVRFDENLGFLPITLSGTLQMDSPTPLGVVVRFDITNFDFTIGNENYIGSGEFYSHFYDEYYGRPSLVIGFDPISLRGSNGFTLDANRNGNFYDDNNIPFRQTDISDYTKLPSRIEAYDIDFSVYEENFGHFYSLKLVKSVPEPLAMPTMVLSLLALLSLGLRGLKKMEKC